jgi:hypothetical protein
MPNADGSKHSTVREKNGAAFSSELPRKKEVTAGQKLNKYISELFLSRY